MLTNFLMTSLTYFIAGPEYRHYLPLPKPTPSHSTDIVVKTGTSGTASGAKDLLDPLVVPTEDGPSTVDCEIGDWCNAFDHDNVSSLLLGTGLLQPKATNWVAYGSNHIRKQWTNWTLSPNPAWVRRESDTLQLPKHGGAIGQYFATTMAPVTYDEAKQTVSFVPPTGSGPTATAAATRWRGPVASLPWS
jgi:hypothetical protein